jgi:hypothetical protein
MKLSKKELVLAYLIKFGSITPDEARANCRKCERLAARISELREDGYNIVTTNKTADGKTVNYAIYRLER